MKWAKISKVHPLIKACIFHFEFETIHPFSDGNGRMGRLWHTLILYKWKRIFQVIYIETIVSLNKEKYYQAIEEARIAAEPGIFIESFIKITKLFINMSYQFFSIY
jgi:Fic family protein